MMDLSTLAQYAATGDVWVHTTTQNPMAAYYVSAAAEREDWTDDEILGWCRLVGLPRELISEMRTVHDTAEWSSLIRQVAEAKTRAARRKQEDIDLLRAGVEPNPGPVYQVYSNDLTMPTR